jgi:hypothetical protein
MIDFLSFRILAPSSREYLSQNDIREYLDELTDKQPALPYIGGESEAEDELDYNSVMHHDT